VLNVKAVAGRRRGIAMKPRAQRVARHQPDHQIVQIQVLPPQRHVRRQRAVQQRGDECNLGAGVARRLLERCGGPCAVSRRTEAMLTVCKAAEFAVGMCVVSRLAHLPSSEQIISAQLGSSQVDCLR